MTQSACHPSAFTAARIAAALGCHKRTLLNRLKDSPASDTLIVNGQTARVWRVNRLPASIRTELAAKASKQGYRSAEALLATPPHRYHAPRLFGEWHERDKAYARRLQKALRPLFERMDDPSLSAGEFWALGVSSYATAFADAPPELKLKPTLSKSQLRRIMDTLATRDGGLEDWDNLELYHPLKWTGGQPETLAREAGCLDEGIRARVRQMPPAPSRDEIARLWDSLFHYYEDRLHSGYRKTPLRRDLLDFLSKTTDCLGANRNSIRVNFDNKYGKWTACGRTWEAITDHRRHNKGRPDSWAYLLKEEDVRARLDELLIATLRESTKTSSRDRRTASVALTLERFADFEECHPQLAKKLRKGYQPGSFVRYLKRITPELEAKIRGPKHSTHAGPVGRRDQTIMGPDGVRYQLMPGDVYEADDMSVNQPFFAEWENGGIILSRQCLCALDSVSGRWLGVMPVARPREAYRSEDVLRFFRSLYEQCGKPRVQVLEKATWAARKIKGIRLTDSGVQEEEWTRPATPDAEVHRIQDGIAALGVQIRYVHAAKSKGRIESGFNHLQNVLATFTPEFLNIGRSPGEFEHAAKQLRRARAGSHHPADLGFAPMSILADRVAQAMAWINDSERTGPKPDNLWKKAVGEQPARPLSRDDLAVFLPEHREIKIQGGRVTVRYKKKPIDFREPELFAKLGDGYRVIVKFDPSEPTLGAAIYNREQGNLNHARFEQGELMGWATFEPPGYLCSTDDPALVDGLEPADVSRYGENPQIGLELRKRQSAWHRTEFRALPRPGQPAVKESTERTGRGKVAKIERGRGRRRLETPAEADYRKQEEKRQELRQRIEKNLRRPLSEEAITAAEGLNEPRPRRQFTEDELEHFFDSALTPQRQPFTDQQIDEITNRVMTVTDEDARQRLLKDLTTEIPPEAMDALLGHDNKREPDEDQLSDEEFDAIIDKLT